MNGIVLVLAALTVAAAVSGPQSVTKDYDTDDDGLIEVSNLEQLDAIRWDLNGDGETSDSRYETAYPNMASGMGCPEACSGYELTRSLDFDDSGSYASGAVNTAWTSGTGWTPIGTSRSRFKTSLEGNGYTLSNLYVNRSLSLAGLFGFADSLGEISGIGLVDVYISGSHYVGGLAGRLRKVTVTSTYVTGEVSGTGNNVGGLVGWNKGAIVNSRSEAVVAGKTFTGGLVGQNAGSGSLLKCYSKGTVSGTSNVGGLVGVNNGGITEAYAGGQVSGTGDDTGGFVGLNNGDIEAGYSVGPVSGAGTNTGGFVGENSETGAITAGYWNTDTSGKALGVGSDDANGNGVIDGAETATAGAVGKTTLEMQTPTGSE